MCEVLKLYKTIENLQVFPRQTDISTTICEYATKNLWDKDPPRGSNGNSDGMNSFDEFINSGLPNKNINNFIDLLCKPDGELPMAYSWLCRKRHFNYFDDEFDKPEYDKLELYFFGNYTLTIPVLKDEEPKVRNYLKLINVI